MKITTKYLKSLGPCQNRYKNWLKHYKDWKGSLKQFLNLKHITYEDKVWVYFRSIPRDQISLVIADFAESVLHIYESAYPRDMRPRNAIQAARNGNGAYAARAAARAADAAYAAAAYAAADAAYAAADAAAYAAAYAASAADADYAARYAAYATRAARYAAYATEQAKQIQIMKQHL